MPLVRINYKTILAAVIAVSYGAFLAYIPMDFLVDRENYLKYVTNSELIARGKLDLSLLAYLFNEPVWLLLNSVLNEFFETPENAIRLYIFCAAGWFSFLLLKRSPRNIWWLIVFLFSPQIIKNYITHLRQGVAITIFFWAFCVSSKNLKYLLLWVTPFVHASFLFILPLFFGSEFLNRTRVSKNIAFLVVIGLLCTLLIVSMRVADFVGARQGLEYADAVLGVSGFGFVFWCLIGFLFLSQGSWFFNQNFFQINLIALYLVFYFFSPVSARIFESGLILIFLAGLDLLYWRRYVFLFGILFYMIISYGKVWDLPLLGFQI